MEVFSFLIAVNRVIRGVDIDDDLFRRRVIGFKKEFDEELREFGIFFLRNSIFETGRVV